MVMGRRKHVSEPATLVPAVVGNLETGLSYLHACRYKEAARDLRRAVDENPESIAAKSYLAIALFHTREFAAAVLAADTALEHIPRDSSLHLIRARALDELGRCVEAIEAVRAALRFDPANKDANIFLSSVSLKIGDTRSAEAALEDAVATDPYDHGILLDLASVRERRGNLAGAIDAVEWAISLNSRNPDHYIRLSNLMDLRGDLEGAIASMLKAWELSPREPSNLYVLARLLLRRRKYADVLRLYEAALRRDGGHRDRYTADLEELSASFLLAEEELRQHGGGSPWSTTPKPELRLVRGTRARKAAPAPDIVQVARDPHSVEALEQAVNADPANSKLRRDLSIRYLQAGRLNEARREAEMAEQLRPRRGTAV
jgi:tetratricopeptide (TPR) repeat protein